MAPVPRNISTHLVSIGPGIRLDNFQVPDWCGLRLFKIGSCDPLDFRDLFMYGILLILLVHINDKRYAKIQLSWG